MLLPLFFLESFVLAFLPFRSGISISPAHDELRLANSIINDELFRRPESAKAAGAESTSPEASLNRMLLHVNAAGTTAGRLSQVFGILIPVRVACYVCLAWCVTSLQLLVALDITVIATLLEMLRDPRIRSVC